MKLSLDRTELREVRNAILDTIEKSTPLDQSTVEFEVVGRFNDRYGWTLDSLPREVTDLIEQLLYEEQNYSLVLASEGA